MKAWLWVHDRACGAVAAWHTRRAFRRYRIAPRERHQLRRDARRLP